MVRRPEDKDFRKKENIRKIEEDGMREKRRYTGRERRQRALIRLSVVLWVLACCMVLCNKAAGAGL